MVFGISGDLYKLKQNQKHPKKKKSKEEFGKKIKKALDDVEESPVSSAPTPAFYPSIPVLPVQTDADPNTSSKHYYIDPQELSYCVSQTDIHPFTQKLIALLKNLNTVYQTTRTTQKQKDLLFVLLGACQATNPAPLSKLLSYCLSTVIEYDKKLEHRQYAVSGFISLLNMTHTTYKKLFFAKEVPFRHSEFILVQVHHLSILSDIFPKILPILSFLQLKTLLSALTDIITYTDPHLQEAALDVGHRLCDLFPYVPQHAEHQGLLLNTLLTWEDTLTHQKPTPLFAITKRLKKDIQRLS